MGCVLTRDEEVQLREMSKLPLRFWAWTPSRPSPSIDKPGQKPPHQLRHLQLAQPLSNNLNQPRPGNQLKASIFLL